MNNNQNIGAENSFHVGYFVLGNVQKKMHKCKTTMLCYVMHFWGNVFIFYLHSPTCLNHSYVHRKYYFLF